VRDANLPGVRTTIADVKEMTRADLPPHDLVIGGPPCQPWSLAGKRLGAADPRDCLPDFVRLRGDAWLMENVAPRLLERMGGGWSQRFCAADFGDVTSRKRWFYSSHVLYVVPTPGPRRFGDIRDHEADRAEIGRRAMANVSPYADGDMLASTTAHAWHGHETRGPTKLVALKIGLRGHSVSVSASAFEDDEMLGSLMSNSWHATQRSRLGPSVRCPSLLEMARAHSIPDTWDWTGVTKTQRGQIIANGWCIGQGTAVCAAMLRAMAYERKEASC
jgi:hypothetical protein